MPAMRRHGYATEAATAVRDWAAAQGLEHLVALIRRENLPSRASPASSGWRWSGPRSCTVPRRWSSGCAWRG
ncbi:GNAT family N-acetyltransferase [Nocardioides sp.]|uniref:GNAT family N-acetyltransferase n=1 Tax=Nocardioides sp. TaxID=35761 RepID=UPI00342795B8